MILARQFRREAHIRVFVVGSVGDRGWEVREEKDDEIVRRTWLHDWHRVENAMMRFAIQATQLQSAGWTEVQSPVSKTV